MGQIAPEALIERLDGSAARSVPEPSRCSGWPATPQAGASCTSEQPAGPA